MKQKKSETRITVRFPSEVITELRTFLEQDDRSLNAEIVQAVREFITRKKGSKRHAQSIQIPPVSE